MDAILFNGDLRPVAARPPSFEHEASIHTVGSRQPGTPVAHWSCPAPRRLRLVAGEVNSSHQGDNHESNKENCRLLCGATRFVIHRICTKRGRRRKWRGRWRRRARGRWYEYAERWRDDRHDFELEGLKYDKGADPHAAE
jgi:hypothetical protein